jgi:aryl-alcohol dehydrogenase-like predicted oxidoreductase
MPQEIPLCQRHIDPQVAIEKTVGVMAELVMTGKVHYMCSSETSAATQERMRKDCIPSVHFNVNSGNRHRPILEYFAKFTATNQKRTGGDGGGYQAEK